MPFVCGQGMGEAPERAWRGDFGPWKATEGSSEVVRNPLAFAVALVGAFAVAFPLAFPCAFAPVGEAAAPLLFLLNLSLL